MKKITVEEHFLAPGVEEYWASTVGNIDWITYNELQNATLAADELERRMKDVGFYGAMINGHTNGQYLDDPMFYPFWERGGFDPIDDRTRPTRKNCLASSVGRIAPA